MITNKDISIDSENGKITLNGNKYDLGTQGEIDTAVKGVYSVMGQNGAKNLIPYPYTNAYRTINGVTITEGSITGSCVFNGTSTGRVDAQLGYRNSNALTLLPSVQYCLSIKTDGSFVGNLAVDAWNKGTTTYAKNIARVTPISTGSDYKEVKFSVTQSDINNYDFAVLIYGTSGNTFNNVTVYPMLRLASDTDNTYQPYAKTNKQLTDQLATKQDTLTFDDAPTASSSNPVTSEGIKTYVDDKIFIKGISLGNTLTITAGGFARADIPCTESGYTPLGIISVQGAATAGAVSLMEFGLSADGTKVYIYYANNTNADKTLSDVRVRVLYSKN